MGQVEKVSWQIEWPAESPEEAFREAVEYYQYLHGTEGATGTIADAEDFLEFALDPGETPQDMVDIVSQQDVFKQNQAYCILKDEDPEVHRAENVYIFFGKTRREY